MNMLNKALQTLRVWLGLADTSESHLTPDHGWLLPAPADARRETPGAPRSERPGEGKGQA